MSSKIAFFLSSLLIFGSVTFADPLTPLQTQLALNTLRSYNLASLVARSVDPSNTPAAPTTDAIGVLYYSMLNLILGGIVSNDCVVGAGSITSATGNCAVLYSDTDNSTYTAVTHNFYIKNDITGFSMGPLLAGGVVSGSGSLISQTLGTIPVVISGTVSNDDQVNFSQAIDYAMTFPGFNAKFSVHQSETLTSHSVTLYLNDVLLSPDDSNYVLLPALQPKPTQSSALRRHVGLMF